MKPTQYLNFRSAAALAALIILSAFVKAQANERVVVIPIFGAESEALGNVVTVAKTGGDFTSPVAALASITDASASRPYLIAIAPGVYSINQTLELKPFVSIVGSGERVTTIKNINKTVTTTMSLDPVNNDAVLVSNLTVENSSGGAACNAILIGSGFGAELKNITAIAADCTSSNLAIDLDTSPPRIKGVTAIARGGVSATGMQSSLAGTSMLEDIDVFVAGASQSNTGLNVVLGALEVANSRLRVVGPTGELYGVKIESGSDLSSLTNTTIEINRASGTNVGFGIHLTDDSEVAVRRSTVSGETAALYADSDSVITVSASSIAGGVTGGTGNTGTKVCFATDDSFAGALMSSCDVP